MADMDDADSERCAAERRQLADGFKRLRTVFAALGDETRQQIFLALLEHDAVGMRVPELTERRICRGPPCRITSKCSRTRGWSIATAWAP